MHHMSDVSFLYILAKLHAKTENNQGIAKSFNNVSAYESFNLVAHGKNRCWQ